MRPRLLLLAGVGVGASAAAVAVAGRLLRAWEARIAVRGHSMEPTLIEGDWLLVDVNAYAHRKPRIGELVVTRDPRPDADRLLVKRVAHIDADGYLALAGDHPAHRLATRTAPPDQILVSSSAVSGRPWFRYWPMERFGRIR